jgi:hypothetical protein
MSDSLNFPPPPPPPLLATRAGFSKLNSAIWILFLISGVFGVGELIAQIVRSQGYISLEDDRTTSKLDFVTSAEDATEVFALLGAYLAIALFVLLIIYTYRLVKKIRNAGFPVRMSNGMAIGSWFIPLANAILTFLFYVDIARADRTKTNGLLLLNLWWWPYIVGVTMSGGFENLITEAETFSDAAVYSYLSVACTGIALVGTAFAILFFRQIRHFEASLDAQARS